MSTQSEVYMPTNGGFKADRYLGVRNAPEDKPPGALSVTAERLPVFPSLALLLRTPPLLF